MTTILVTLTTLGALVAISIIRGLRANRSARRRADRLRDEMKFWEREGGWR